MAAITYAYQWYRMLPNGSPSAISGATQSNYTLASADQGFEVYCQVTATDSAGSTVAVSATTPVITASNSGTIELAQSVSVPTGTSPTINITLPDVTINDLLTVAGESFANIAISSIVGGGTWKKAESINLSTGGEGTVEQWYCLSTTGGTSVPITINLASAPAANKGGFIISEWTGPTSWTFDQSVPIVNAASSSTPVSPAIVPAQNGELIIVGGAFQGKVTAVSTGWKQISTTYTNTYLNGFGDAAYIVYEGNSSIACTWTQSADNHFSASIMAFIPTYGPTTIPNNVILPTVTDNTSNSSVISVGDSLFCTTGSWD